MKTRINLIATLLLLLASNAAFSIDPPATKNVQVLPAAEGVLKVLYYNPSERNVTVKIYSEDGIIFQDHVKVAKGKNGFLKRYKIDKPTSNVYWVEIGDENMSQRFRVLHLGNGKMYATYWDQFHSPEEVIAAK